MKAVVLARGKGTRMQRADAEAPTDTAQARMADSGVKAMIPFRRPFLDYVLSALADAGCLDVCLVIGPGHDLIRDYYTREGTPERVRITFATQQEALGTADAVLTAETFAQNDPFLALNADNYYPADVLRALTTLDGPGSARVPQIDAAPLEQHRSGSHSKLRHPHHRRAWRPPGYRRKAGSADAGGVRRRFPGQHELLAVRALDLRGLPRHRALASWGDRAAQRRSLRRAVTGRAIQNRLRRRPRARFVPAE